VDCLAPAPGQPQASPSQRLDPPSSLQAALTLDDALARVLEHRKKDGGWGAEFSVDLLTSLVSIFWLGWVVRTRDARLWTKTLLSAATLAALKGFLAWATVLPDASGWEGCQERLGADGLAYYRQLAAVGSSGGGLWQSLQDILLLELRGFWMMGRAARQHICADTVFSAPTCFCVLFAASLYDAVRTSISTATLEETMSTRRSTAAALAGTLLVLVVLVEFELMVSRPHHYTLDVVLAVALTLLVYGNPAVAVATERWIAQIGDSSPSSGLDDSCDAPCMLASEPLRDVGLIGILPCCIPFCAISGQYYLREEPSAPLRRPWTAESKRQHERQASEMSQVRERMNEERRRLEGRLEEERRKGAERNSNLIAQADEKVQALEQQLHQRKEAIVAEAMQRVEAARQAKAQLEEKAAAEVRRRTAALAPLRERRARLAAEVAAMAKERGESSITSAAQETRANSTLLPSLRGSFGDAVIDIVCK